MRRLLVCLFLVAGPASAAPGRTLEPCVPGSEPHLAATRELEAIGAEIERLKPGTPTAAVVGRLHRLMESRCLEMVDELDLGEKVPVLALKDYWESGGRDHLRSFLDLGKKGDVHIWSPPTVRQVLGDDVIPPGHRLHALVCPVADARCGVETLGWALRAEEFLDAQALSTRDCQRDDWQEVQAARRRPAGDLCNCLALQAPRDERFRRYLDCRAETQRKRQALPLGRLREPAGWLTLSGRRGHYSFCDELRAYDLATGSAVRVSSCSGLALRPNGSVDCRATDDRRKVEVALGHVPAAAIRETAWMLLMLEAVQNHVALEQGTMALDARIPRLLHAPAYGYGVGCGLSTGSSGDTQLSWRVLRAGHLLGAGTVTWPSNRNSAAAAHATSLLRIAEAAFIPGCPAASPPRGTFDEGLSLRTNELDGDATSLRTADSALTEAWKRALGSVAACRRAASRR